MKVIQSKKHKDVVVVAYKSVTDSINYLTDIRKNPSTFLNNTANQSTLLSCTGSYRHALDWTGFQSHDDFLETLRKGDKEIANKIRALKAVDFSPSIVRRRTVWGEQGDMLDIHRVNRGESDVAWRSSKRNMREGGSRYVDVYMNGSGNCNLNSDELAWNGLLALKVTSELVHAGYFVRLTRLGITEHINNKGTTVVTTLMLKDYDEDLVVPKLAAIVGHGGFHRMMDFAAIVHASDFVGREVYGGLGRATTHEKAGVIDSISDYLGSFNNIFLNAVTSEKSYTKEIEWITTAFK